MQRREFVAAGAVGPAVSAAARLPIRRAVYIGMLPKGGYEERFWLAREVGFEAIECATVYDESEAAGIRKASEAAGLPIHSVMNSDHWKYPLSSPDPEVIARSLHGMETSLRNARAWGADTVLLVPAVVNPQVRYEEAWKRSQEHIRKLLPLAAKLKVAIGIENVWNKFLLSPLEMARYVDEFQSPWVRAYFDVGNVALFGYPQDWIRTLGGRIVKLHLKDFQFKTDQQTRKRSAEFTDLREGELDWKEIHRALGEIQFRGVATVELRGGDEPYLREVVRRVDLILQGA